MRDDPYTLVVALDAQGKANGTLYIDDGISFDYSQKEKKLYMQFNFEGRTLTGHQLVKPNYQTGSWLERVVILGASELGGARLKRPSQVELKLETSFDPATKAYTVRKPGVNMAEEWEIVFA